MMFGWLSAGRRIAMMENDIAGLRALVADLRGDVRTGAALDLLGGRLAELSEHALGRGVRLSAIEVAINELKADLVRVDARQLVLERQLQNDASTMSEEVRRDMSLLRSRIVALDQELKRQGDDNTKAVTALAGQLARSRAVRDAS